MSERSEQRSRLVLTATGSDRPGLTAALLAAIAAHDVPLDAGSSVEIHDVEQVVIRGQLVLGLSLQVRGEVSALVDTATRTADSLGLSMTVTNPELSDDEAGAGADEVRHHIIVLGHPLGADALAVCARRVAEAGANIESIGRLSHYPVTSLELVVAGGDAPMLRASLAAESAAEGFDVAVERAGLARRAKRLVVFDVDSTLITGEVIDLLAAHAGQQNQISEITRRAMAGELDFTTSLQERVRLLAGLPESTLDEVREQLVFTPGARTLVRTLHRLGFQCALVSGGFSRITDQLAAELEMDFAAANTLAIEHGRLTGELTGEIIDRAGKANALRRFAEQARVPLSQTVAVGDGANDIDMLAAAGLGIAFNAKSALREVADTSLNQPYLDAVLFFLGIAASDIDD